MNKVLLSAIVLGALAVVPFGADSASPDGPGVWADQVLSAPQGTRQDGSAIAPENSDPWDALGAAESMLHPSDKTIIASSYFSLGFGGNITVKFDQPIVNHVGTDVHVVAIDPVVIVPRGTPVDQIPARPTARVEASADAMSWTIIAENVSGDVKLDLGALPEASYILITDTSDRQLFAADTEGYRIDGIRSLPQSRITRSFGMSSWRGKVKGLGSYRRDRIRDNDFLNGHVIGYYGNRDYCAQMWNEAISFHNNYELNPVYRDVAFQDTVFHGNNRSQYRHLDGVSIKDIHQMLMSLECDNATSNISEVKNLRSLFHSLNAHRFTWYYPVAQ